MTEQRFTDKEVAIILRRAADLEKRPPSAGGSSGRGLTLSDLKEIAAEAGIDPEMVSRAVTELASPKGLRSGSLLIGPDTVRREVRAAQGELSKEEMAELVRVVDEEVRDQGIVQEALGHVRWTSQGRFLSTQVSLEPGGGETLIRVEERHSDAIRGVLHAIPASYGLIFGLAGALEGMNLGLVPGALFALASAAAGWGLGGAIWRGMAGRSKARVQRLAERLGIRAREMAEKRAPELPGGGH
jgi:hypothetical protein